MTSTAVRNRVGDPTQSGQSLRPRGARRADANWMSDGACREQA